MFKFLFFLSVLVGTFWLGVRVGESPELRANMEQKTKEVLTEAQIRIRDASVHILKETWSVIVAEETQPVATVANSSKESRPEEEHAKLRSQ